MNAKTLRMRLKPHLWYQAYWVIYLHRAVYSVER